MVIVSRIAGAGENGLTRIPVLDVESVDDELCTNGVLDEGKVRSILGHKEDLGIQFASKDDRKVLAFAVELLLKVSAACNQILADRHPELGTRGAHATPETKDDLHAARNYDRGRVVFVRIQVTHSRAKDVLRLVLDIQNPNAVAGVAWTIANDYALIVARVANNMRDQLEEDHGGGLFEFCGGPGCPDVFDEARRIDADLKHRADVMLRNAQRFNCPHYRNGYCTADAEGNAPRFDCPCHERGRCVEEKP